MITHQIKQIAELHFVFPAFFKLLEEHRFKYGRVDGEKLEKSFNIGSCCFYCFPTCFDTCNFWPSMIKATSVRLLGVAKSCIWGYLND